MKVVDILSDDTRQLAPALETHEGTVGIIGFCLKNCGGKGSDPVKKTLRMIAKGG